MWIISISKKVVGMCRHVCILFTVGKKFTRYKKCPSLGSSISPRSPPPRLPPTWNALLTILTPDTLLPHNSGRAITWIIFKIVKIIFYLRSYVGIIIQDWKLKYFRNYQLFFYTISTYVHLIRIYVQLLYILNKLELTKLHL